MDSFFFYDLETSGISASRDRIMQFGGQRTDLNLKATGEPFNLSIRLTPDILPAPEAILISGLSPLANLADGICEAEFVDIFNKEIAKPGTIFTGFNNLRFDDEFIRYTNYRNFYDAYSWHWQDHSSRWDILDVARMTRALRPKGINWPFNEEGKPSNKLEHLTLANKLEHKNAHDALSDALATIDVARLIKDHQPKLFNYLLSLRKKATLAEVIKSNPALVYTSSHYPSEILHTTVVSVISFDQELGAALVFDLRNNPKDYIDLSVDELVTLWEYDPDQPRSRLPVKTMKLNRCPAIAPLNVLDKSSIERLGLNMDDINNNLKQLLEHKDQLAAKLKEVTKKLDSNRDQRNKAEPRMPLAEERLYDKFIPKSDSALFSSARVRAKLSSGYELNFSDKRLNSLYSLYRARNYPSCLTTNEIDLWHQYVRDKLFLGEDSHYSRLMARIDELKKETTDPTKTKLLDDLVAYSRAIAGDYEADLPAAAA